MSRKHIWYKQYVRQKPRPLSIIFSYWAGFTVWQESQEYGSPSVPATHPDTYMRLQLDEYGAPTQTENIPHKYHNQMK
jgi:hypothetical protein